MSKETYNTRKRSTRHAHSHRKQIGWKIDLEAQTFTLGGADEHGYSLCHYSFVPVVFSYAEYIELVYGITNGRTPDGLTKNATLLFYNE